MRPAGQNAETLHLRFREFIGYLNRRGWSNRQISLRIGRASRYIDNVLQKRTDVGTVTVRTLYEEYGMNFAWYFTGCGPRRIPRGLIENWKVRKQGARE